MLESNNSLQLVHSHGGCEVCDVRSLCLPMALTQLELAQLDNMVMHRKPVDKGEFLFRSGDDFRGIFAVQSGVLKSYNLTLEGKEHVTGFYLSGELLGLDAIDSAHHPGNAVALEKAKVCVLPFDRLQDLSRRIPRLQHELARAMSREILREQHILVMLGITTAEQRMARFLLNWYRRMQDRGGARDHVDLCMSRQDIANYLGIAIETVSRQLKQLQARGIISTHSRRISIMQLACLEDLAH